MTEVFTLHRGTRPLLVSFPHVGTQIPADQQHRYTGRALQVEDTDWFLRSRDLGIVWALIPDVLLIRRIHGANLTYDTEAQRRSMFELLQRRMARRRVT
mgnify:CR=1 FL=1